MAKKTDAQPIKLRSQAWFNNPDNIDMTALYLERMMNYGLSLDELQSGKPIIGIAQSGSDITPCNRHHLDLAKRTREGIREAGGQVRLFAGESGWQTFPIIGVIYDYTSNEGQVLMALADGGLGD